MTEPIQDTQVWSPEDFDAVRGDVEEEDESGAPEKVAWLETDDGHRLESAHGLREPRDQSGEDLTDFQGATTADDDTIVVEGNGRARPDQTTEDDEQWPVSDLYYIDPVEAASGAVADDPTSASVVTTSGEGRVRRRFPHEVGVGEMLAALAVLAALVFGGVLLGLNDDEPTATAQGPTSPTSTTPPAETTPALASATKVEVTGVEGMSLGDAREQLERQGLEVRVTRSPSERPRGDVLSQAPPAGSRVDEGTVVALVASRGTGSGGQPADGALEVPGVVGLSAAAAVAELRDAGLDARVRQVASSQRQGTVVDQRPSQGAAVAHGSAIVLEVARPRAVAVERIEIPDVIGSTAAAARSELRAAGLRVTTTGVVSQEPPGTVVSQSPQAGADVRKGSRVLLTVSTPPATVDVPDVTGLDEAAARSELERAGFVVRVSDESTTDPAQDGIVIRQTPMGGSDAQDGHAVTIVVGRLG